MNRYISSKEALDVLSVLAPRPWCKKLLLQLMFEKAIRVYAGAGHFVGRVPILTLLDDESVVPGDGEKFWEAVQEKYGVVAPKEADLITTPRGTLAPVTGYRWTCEQDLSQYHEISWGYYLYADYLDWDLGELKIESIFPFETNGVFPEDDIMFSERRNIDHVRFSWLEFSVVLQNLAFDRSAIELLVGSEQTLKIRSAASVGRPTKWDWNGALIALIRKANEPDGLPTGHGAQASIERHLSDWFVFHYGEQPAASQIRHYAQKVMVGLDEK